ncbi:MAG: glycosyltransferase [Minisyncoccia bacterium]
MHEPLSLSIFLPAYDEAENVAAAIADARRAAEESPYIGDWEIILVDDGSKDKTRAIAIRAAQKDPCVRVVWHPKNRGYGAALKTGIRASRKDWVFFTDADRQFDFTELSHLLAFAPRYDAVIGYRAPRRDPFMRLLNAWGWNALNRLFFGLKIRDIDCAFKLLRRAVVLRAMPTSRGAMVSAELLIRLTRSDARIKEVPVSHLPRRAGSPTGAKPSVILRALHEMIALYTGELGSVTNKQAMKFMTVGVINTLLDAAFYIILTRETSVFAEHLVAAKFFSFLAGTVSSLTLNRSWTFGMKKRLSFGEVARFYTTISVSLVVNVEAMNLLVSWGMYDLLALAVTTVFTFAASFTLSKFWVFRSREPDLVRQRS